MMRAHPRQSHTDFTAFAHTFGGLASWFVDARLGLSLKCEMRSRGGGRQPIRPQVFSPARLSSPKSASPATPPPSFPSPQPSGGTKERLLPGDATHRVGRSVFNASRPSCPFGRLRGSRKVVKGVRGRRRKPLGALWGFRRLPCDAFRILNRDQIARAPKIPAPVTSCKNWRMFIDCILERD